MKSFKEYIAETAVDVELVEADKESTEYKEYFAKMLKKYKVDAPDDLSDEDKKKFFDEVDAGWKADKETDED